MQLQQKKTLFKHYFQKLYISSILSKRIRGRIFWRLPQDEILEEKTYNIFFNCFFILMLVGNFLFRFFSLPEPHVILPLKACSGAVFDASKAKKQGLKSYM